MEHCGYHAHETVHAAHVCEIDRLNERVNRLRGLVQTLLDNDPHDMAADGVTVLCVWRKEAHAALDNATAPAPDGQ